LRQLLAAAYSLSIATLAVAIIILSLITVPFRRRPVVACARCGRLFELAAHASCQPVCSLCLD
jgi:hypothetical protein